MNERVPVDFTKVTQEAWDYKLRAVCSIDFLNSGEYKDKEFRCAGCRKMQTWTAEQQKWWYEEMKGSHFTTAIRCRACRKKEKMRKDTARDIHLSGIRQKNSNQSAQVNPCNPPENPRTT